MTGYLGASLVGSTLAPEVAARENGQCDRGRSVLRKLRRTVLHRRRPPRSVRHGPGGVDRGGGTGRVHGARRHQHLPHGTSQDVRGLGAYVAEGRSASARSGAAAGRSMTLSCTASASGRGRRAGRVLVALPTSPGCMAGPAAGSPAAGRKFPTGARLPRRW
jgi:hypothetical protein